MKKVFLLFSVLLLSVFVTAQQTYYAAARSGLSVREQPGTSSKVIGKIPYSTKLDLIKDTATLKGISTEGFTGYWWKIKYNDQVGYVVNSYVFPAMPPNAAIKTLKDYFEQVSTAYGKPLIVSKENFVNIEDENTNLTKQLYNNGMEYQQVTGYEYSAELYLLPGFTIEQAYLLLRLLNQYPYIIGENETFPSKNNTVKNEQMEKVIEVERENYGDNKRGPVKKIRIFHTEAIVTEIEIFTLDQQVAIRVNAGV